MAGPIRVSGGGIVSFTLNPPIEFIEAQTGAFGARLQDMTGLWDRFADTMEQIGVERFGTKGYGEWPPLAESTIKEKAREGFPFGPLIRTGELVDSLTDRERAMRMLPQSMTWGTDVDYAHFHQDGGSTPGRPPQRKVLDIRVEDRRRLETDMVAWINEVAAETVGRGL